MSSEWSDKDVRRTDTGYELSDAAAAEVIEKSFGTDPERCGNCGRVAGVPTEPCMYCTDHPAQKLNLLQDFSGEVKGEFYPTSRIWDTLKGPTAVPSSGTMQRWADVAMWQSPIDRMAERGELVRPQVTLLSMTPQPLQVMAAAAALYRGEIRRSVQTVTIEESLHWLKQAMTSRGSQPQLEFVDLHFLIEGVTRAFTHQLVRQRVGATYIQESMRFAVKDNAGSETSMPPHIENLPEDHPMRVVWQQAVAHNSWAYNAMVNGGVPAEDARGILPTNITTRIHYKTTLRGLVDHAGLRLCSQAQFEWKQVWDGMIREVRQYGPHSERWQQRAIASLFRPVCYHTGKCEFMGEHDRFCPIRERVMAHHSHGEGPSEWHDIDPLEPVRYGVAIVPPDMAQ